MSRYIDADAYAAEMKTRQDACLELMNAAREMDNEEMYGQKSAAFSVFVEAKLTLEAMPTVDAVPVVRCGECGHYHSEDDPAYCDELCKIHIDKTDGCLRGIKRGAEVGYRAVDGERKDGEHE